MNATETFLQSLQQKSGARVGTMLTLDQRDPDAVAEQMRVGAEFGLPANVIAADPDGFKRQLAQKKNTTALTNAPKTSKWLQDLNNGVLAKDDVDNLSWFEQSMRSYVDMGDAAEATVPGRMVQRGGLRIAANPSQFKAGAAGQVLADQGKTFDDIYAEIIAPYGDNAPASVKVAAQQVAQIRADRAEAADVTKTALSGAEALAEARDFMARIETLEMSDTSKAFRDGPLKDTPDTLGGLAEAIWSDPVGGAAFIAETFGEFLPILAASAATTALTRSPATGTAVLASGSFLSENASSAQEFLSSKGVDMSTPEAALAVLNDADLMREAGERGATRGVIIGALDALSGGIAGQALAKNPGGDVLVQSLAQMVLGGGGEALATAAVGDEINWKEVGLEAVGEALTLPFDLVIGGRTIKDIEQSATSGKTAAALDELDAMAAKSKLKQRSPERFAEALDAQGSQDFYVPAEDLREYFQAKDVNFDDETLQAWGIDPVEFETAEAAGGDVAIPRSAYATRISGTEDAAWFRDNASMSADEMSAAQAARFNSEVRETMEKALADAEAQRSAEMEVRASDVQVYDSVFTQLREAGRTRDVADNEARVWSSFWRTMGERYGSDPLALAQSMGVEIRGPQTPEASRRRNDLDIKLNTLRANPEKALKPSGVDLLTFIRSEGGISDVGGDVEAMDAPKGVIAESRADYEARRGQPNLDGSMAEGRGKGLDDLGRAAIEAGYFPELMGGADIQADGTVVDEAAVLLAALQRAISGESIYPAGEGADPDLAALYEQISERGLDLREMSNDEIAAALEETGGRKYDQPSDTGAKRGSIVLPSGGLENGQTVINLFENANLSTFLHESGHFFLEAFTALATSQDAPQAMRDDLAAIHKFLKVEDGANLTTEQHEMWARGFEAYAMEGKAPSLELADAFGRFKSWLTRIYRSIKGLNVKLNPEIREVMDRMLATDEEIQAARETQQMSPLFTDQAASGMSDAAWSTYQRMARRSEEEASQALLEKTMAKVRREKEKWWKDERKEVRKEVETTINSKPEYRLIEMLANQRWIGSDQEVPDFQLDRKELVEAFGEGVLAELSRSRFGGKRAIYGADGVSLHEAADFFGFANPSEMIETLQNTGKRQDAIELETDRIMSDRYGDPLNDGSIEEEAVAAIHSEQQAQTVASEIRHLAGQAGNPTRNLTAKVFRQRARLMLGRMSVKEATRPDAFLAAERKAARRAEDTFARVARGRDAGAALATAAKHKEQQLLNHYLYLESRDLSKMVASKREKMRDYNKNTVREKLDGGYIEQIDALLDGYDFRVRSAGQVQRSENLRQFVERMTEEGRAGELAIDERLIGEANRKHYTKLSVDELHGLFDTIENIDHMGRFKKKLQDAKDARDLAEIVGGITEGIETYLGTENAEKQSGSIRAVLNLATSADSFLAMMSGDVEFGYAYQQVKSRVDQGETKFQSRTHDIDKTLADLFKMYSASELADNSVPKKRDGVDARLWSKNEIISLALNIGTESSLNRVLSDTAHRNFRLTPEQVVSLVDTLEARDWEFVKGMWKAVNDLWPEIAAVHKRRTGQTLEKVQGRAIETKFGTINGQYYPLRYSNITAKGQKNLDTEADLMNAAGRFGKADVRMGFTNARAKRVSGLTVHYGLDVPFRHMVSVVRGIELSEAVDNAQRILSGIQQPLIDAGHADIHEKLSLWLKDVGNGPIFHADPFNRVARFAKNNFSLSRLAFNFKTTALQVTGLTQTAVLVGKKNMLLAFRDYRRAPHEILAEVSTASKFMAERENTMQKEMYDLQMQMRLKGPEGPKTKAGQKASQAFVGAQNFFSIYGFWQIQKAQYLAVDVPTWLAAYRDAQGKDMSDKDSTLYADRIVARAQGNFSIPDRTAIERGTLNENVRQSDIVKTFALLKSYMFTKFNLAQTSTRRNFRDIAGAETSTGRMTAATSWAGDMFLLYWSEALFWSMVGMGWAALDGDDDDPEPSEVAKFLAAEVGTSIVGGIPFASDVYSGFQGYGSGGPIDHMTGIPGALTKQVAQGELDRAAIRAMLEVAGMSFGFPTTQTMRVIDEVSSEEGSIAAAILGKNPLTR